MQLDKLVQEILEDYEREPTGIGGAKSELDYLFCHVRRFTFAIADLLAILSNRFDMNARVLDISTYCGFVAVALAKSGYSVKATDLPGIFNCDGLVRKLNKFGVDFKESDLIEELPYPDSSFEAVSCCETLEHLNFNPIVALEHIHRVLAPSGILYLTVPNASRFYNIFQHVKGQADDSFMDMFATRCADGSYPLRSIGVHWHEYSTRDIRRALAAAGFKVIDLKYMEHFNNYSFFKRLLVNLILRCFPYMSETIVVIAEKT